MSSEYSSFGRKLYYMNDKNIHDGLLARRVKVSDLVSFLSSRGFIVSNQSTKAELLEVLKTIRFDYFDYSQLSSILENPDRKDNISNEVVNERISISTLKNTIDKVNDSLKIDDVQLKLTVESKKRLSVEVNYVDVDFTKPPMRQKSTKKEVVEIRVDDDSANIVFPATEMGKRVKNEIISQVSKYLNKKITPKIIDFSYKSCESRTLFFTRLIREIPSYDVFDVVSTSVKSSSDEASKTATDTITGLVRNAVLKGRAVLDSNIYQSLPGSEYYIYKISWKIREVKPGVTSEVADCYSVEAQFDDTENSKGFRYLVKQVQRYSNGKLNSTYGKLSKSEVDELSDNIYRTALKIYESIN
ncbi:hypothetical protein [Leucothrix mucor]|uniref:hypothetical protein n=1 Tax=Leucothrix mucor TaxID=45248 RepID=UPI0003B682AA|nr:hypothetical protein [Leucothrix mucor]